MKPKSSERVPVPLVWPDMEMSEVICALFMNLESCLTTPFLLDMLKQPQSKKGKIESGINVEYFILKGTNLPIRASRQVLKDLEINSLISP